MGSLEHDAALICETMTDRTHPMRRCPGIRVVLLLGFLAVDSSAAADRAGLQLERRFANTVRPFLETYCVPWCIAPPCIMPNM